MSVTSIGDEMLKNMFENLPEIARSNGTTESLALANCVVRAFLTNKWANKYIVPNAMHRSFLTIDESTPQRREITLYRVIDLAEILVNLQDVRGFNRCLKKLRGGDIEGTYAELDLGPFIIFVQSPIFVRDYYRCKEGGLRC
jgi:hypothetical protein